MNGGAAQRSRVTELKVTFAGAVDLQAGAFTLTRQSDGLTISSAAGGQVGVVTSLVGGTSVATLTFGGGGGVQSLSLNDGVWVLRVYAGKVSATGTTVGMASDYATPSSGTGRIFRLFGDSNGNATVDNIDSLRLRNTYGRNSAEPLFRAKFDYNINCLIDNIDQL